MNKKNYHDEKLHLAEVRINLPVQMMVEQVELKLNQQNKDIFQKYFKLAGITRSSQTEAEQIRNEMEVSKDIQFSVLGKDPETEQKRKLKTKFLKMTSGYHD